MKNKLFATLVVLLAATASIFAQTINHGHGLQEYKLDNGLTVFLWEDKDATDVHGRVVCRAGAVDEPSDYSGLAHYLEHMLFKGTDKIGAIDWEKEKPLYEQIIKLYDEFNAETDENKRLELIKKINEVSLEAAQYGATDDFSNLTESYGGDNLNAFTSYDLTAYFNTFPAGALEKWLEINSERLLNPVFRSFQAELENVYEEFNMYQDDLGTHQRTFLFGNIYKGTPYERDVIGFQHHLKNPSLSKLIEFFQTWYVPNNMAICLSGDFNPDEMVAIIEKHFGGMKPNPQLPVLEVKEEAPITTPIVREVWGLEAENLMLAWRTPKASDKDADSMNLLANLLYNGQAGLIDLNVNQQQKVLGAYAGMYSQADHSLLIMAGNPKAGQTLEEVKDLMLAEVEKLRKGEFDEGLLQATVNNYKLSKEAVLESNGGRANMFVSSFINGTDWADEVTFIDRLSKFTKEDMVALANKYLGAESYVVVYKREGKDPNEKIITKPAITPIKMNRDTASVFLNEVVASVVEPIEPKFVDFEKDMNILQAQSGIEVLYKQNTTNRTFELEYIFDMGDYHDKALSMAAQYLEYLGTSDMTPEEVKRAFYDMACGFSVNPGNERTYLSLSGLHENMPKAIALFEKLLADAQVNAAAYTNLVNDELKARQDAKLDQSQNFARLSAYAQYGPKNPYTHILSEKELKAMNPQQLVDRIHALNGYKHRVLYYGPASQEELLALLKAEHKVPETLKEVPAAEPFAYQTTDKTRIFVAPYVAQQTYISQFSNRNEAYDVAIEPQLALYNEYFDGNMGSIVFQEMRESRGLAYGASASFSLPSYSKYPFVYRSRISTQTDKMMDAIGAFDEIINDMPQSEPAFDLAKNGSIDRLRTQRINKSSVLWEYVDAQDMGVTVNRDKAYYDFLQTATLQDVVKFQQQWVKGRTYHFAILGDKKHLDMKALKQMGEVIELTTEDIFGY